MDNLLLAVFNFHYENVRRQNKGLSNVNLQLSSSWLVLSFLALSLPPSVPDMARSQPLPFPTAHPHPAHYSPGVTLHPTRLKSLIKSTSPESLPASDECGGPGKWQCSQGKAAAFSSCLYFVWSRSKPQEDLNSDLLGPRGTTGLPASMGQCHCASCSSPHRLHYLVLRRKHFLIERVWWCSFSWPPLLWQGACICIPFLGSFTQCIHCSLQGQNLSYPRLCCVSCDSREQLWDCPGPCNSCSPFYFSERRDEAATEVASLQSLVPGLPAP